MIETHYPNGPLVVSFLTLLRQTEKRCYHDSGTASLWLKGSMVMAAESSPQS